MSKPVCDVISQAELDALVAQRDELLAALKVAETQMTMDGHTCAFDGLGTSQLAQVRAAIARAEGRTK